MKTYRIRYKNKNGVIVTQYVNANNESEAIRISGLSDIVEVRNW